MVNKIKAGLFGGTPPRTRKDLPLVAPYERIRKEQACTDSRLEDELQHARLLLFQTNGICHLLWAISEVIN